MRKMLLCATVALISFSAHAGYVIQGATIVNVGSTNGNAAQFHVVVTGGAGPCVGQTILFHISNAPDADTHKRAYAAALLALAMGYRVNIYNYTDNNCAGASYIDIGP
jgi:Family of unknown function (DUF5992)